MKNLLILLFASKKCVIYSRIRYLISQKSGITYVISHNYARIKVDSYDYLTREKTLTLHNVIIHIKSVYNRNRNHDYYNIFLEKCSYQLAKK